MPSRRLIRALSTAAASACSSTPRQSAAGPVLWRYLPENLPYSLGLLLQETLVARRLSARKLLATPSLSPSAAARAQHTAATDVLLLLQHTPVYTAGRREKDPAELEKERIRLGGFGADHVSTMRGGQTTYHGPGQLVGYSIMDIGAAGLSTRCYVDHMERFLDALVVQLGVTPYPIEHTGVFVSPTSKIGSIGIHIRRRVTLHGFSLNIEPQVLPWFGHIVACGLDDVAATSVATERGSDIKVEDVVPLAVAGFGKMYGREMRELTPAVDADLWDVIQRGVRGELPPLEGL